MVEFLVHLDEVPVHGAKGLALCLGSFGAHGSSPNQIAGALALLRGEKGPVNSALPGVELDATAFHRDTIQCAQVADGTEAASLLLGDERSPNVAELTREDSSTLNDVPQHGGAMQSGVAKQGKVPHMEPISATGSPSLETAAGFAELGGAQQREGCPVRVSREEAGDLVAAAAVLLYPVLLPSFAINREHLVVPSRFNAVAAPADNGWAPGFATEIRMATAGAASDSFSDPVLPAALTMSGGRRDGLSGKQSNFVALGGNEITPFFVRLA